jgi:hypothetical protein
MLLVKSLSSSKMMDNSATTTCKTSIASKCRRVFTFRKKPGWVLKIALLWRPFLVAKWIKVQLSNVDAVRVYVNRLNSGPISVLVLTCNKMATSKSWSALTNSSKLMALRINNFRHLRKPRWTTCKLSLRSWYHSLVTKTQSHNNNSNWDSRSSQTKFNLATWQWTK